MRGRRQPGHSAVFTILLVDDDTKLLHALQTVLEGEGYRVLTAPDGEIATAIAVKNLPDLVITDWMMPRVDGVALCTRIKADPTTNNIPVVMWSAALLPLPEEPLWNVFLRKPIPIERLLEAITNLLHRPVALPSRCTQISGEPPATGAG